MSKFKVGDKVEFIDAKHHMGLPSYYPKEGTIGTVVDVCPDGTISVQWPQGSTCEDDLWWVNVERVRAVSNDKKILITTDGKTTLQTKRRRRKDETSNTI